MLMLPVVLDLQKLAGVTGPVVKQADFAALMEAKQIVVAAVRYAEALATLNDVEREPEFADEAGTMTFQIASLLEWELPVKQHFLAIRSATERVARLLHALPSLLGSLEARAQVHRRASLNGKGGSPPPMTDALS